ncbi:MAG: hypothetical protein ACO394_09445, partial [Blastocatellia bacterium]
MSGNLIIVSAPSGAGKTTLVAEVLRRDERVRPSVSYTSRSPRPGEIDGQHYHFVTRERFVSLIEEAKVPAREAGVLVELPLREGDTLAKGDEIARIDDDQPRMEKRRAQAEHDQAVAKS